MGLSMASRSVVRITRSSTWREGSHPRRPAGSSQGGKFAPRGVSSVVLVRGAGHARWAERTAKHIEVVYQFRGRTTSATFGQKLFGRPLSKSDYVALTGALPGSKIKLEMQGSRMHLYVEHPLYRAHRVVFRDHNGILAMKNEWFGLEDHAQRGRGLGARIFARQVDGVAKFAIQRIQTQAVRQDDNVFADHRDSINGYYTWARLGYNATLRLPDKRKLLDSGSPALAALGAQNTVTLHELFDMPGGREHWYEHGGTIDMRFDPTPNSPHRQRLDEYLYKKGIRPYAA